MSFFKPYLVYVYRTYELYPQDATLIAQCDNQTQAVEEANRFIADDPYRELRVAVYQLLDVMQDSSTPLEKKESEKVS